LSPRVPLDPPPLLGPLPPLLPVESLTPPVPELVELPMPAPVELSPFDGEFDEQAMGAPTQRIQAALRVASAITMTASSERMRLS
jgi:hypothetical protein